MTTPFLYIPTFAPVFNGQSVPNGLLYTYEAGTTNPKPTFVDPGGIQPNTNPVELDVTGAATVRLEPGSYHFVLYDATGTQVLWDQDFYNAPYLTADDIGALIYSQTAQEATVGIIALNTRYPPLDPRRYASIADWSAVYESISSLSLSYEGWYRGDHAQHPTLTNCIAGFQSYDDSQKTGTVGYRCTVFGAQAMQQNKNSVAAGGTNTAFGWGVMENCVECSGNTAVGAVALNSITGVLSSHNNAFGYRVLTLLVDGTQNNCFGFQTANSLVTGNNNHAFGENTLQGLTSGGGNHAFGYQCLYSKTTGDNTHAFGFQCLFNETSGAANTAFGHQAGLGLTSKSNNVIIGFQAANSGSVGDSNTVMGFQAAQALNNGDLNVVIGYQAGLRMTSGTGNTVMGEQAGNILTTGGENVILGDNAGQGMDVSNRNTWVGGITGVHLNGNNNTGCGYNSGSVGSAQTYTNVGCFGANSVPTASNQIVLGDPNIATLRCQQTSITSLSDIRFKFDIAKLEIPAGFLDELQVVTFQWIDPAMPKGQQVGVIAQALDQLQIKYDVEWLGLVDKSDPNRWEATPGKLLFLLIQRVQQHERRLQRIEALLFPEG